MKKQKNKKVVVAMSPKQSLRDATGQAGGLPKKKKVVIAMSGGIDSSVAAALLKRAGSCSELGRRVDLIGVFMKFWSEPGLKGAWNRCCSPEAEKRASWVAKSLGIPFYIFNFEKEFKKRIVDYFLEGYKEGITPNPCVVCNKEIKFGLLLEKALEMGVDFVATGHYARLRREIRNPKFETRNYRYRLLRGKDKMKDQSYFLWQLSQEQLKHILFPVGDYTKDEVRNLAKKFRLPVFDIPESMEICFIPTTINDFLKKYLKEKPGEIVDNENKVIGQHRGLWFYTIGQRKGIGLSDGPYYVLDKDYNPRTGAPATREALASRPATRQGKNIYSKKNLLIVTKRREDLAKKELIAKNVNWISGKVPKMPLKIKAQIRYRHQAVPATLYKIQNTKYKILFNQSQPTITPGQSVVFYSPAQISKKFVAGRGQQLLGGGIIC